MVLAKKIINTLLLFLLFEAKCFAASADDSTIISSQKDAAEYLSSISQLSPSKYWPNVNAKMLMENLQLNVSNPLSFYAGRSTNFCGYGALSYILMHEDPLGYTKFIVSIYQNGEAEFKGIKFSPSRNVREAAGNLFFKGKLDMRHAEQIWFLTLADKFKGYLNLLNLHYQLGDENTFWAATNLAKFNRMARKLTNYKVHSVGSDLIRPWVKNMYNYLEKRLNKGYIVLYLNNKIINRKNHDRVKISIPTHFVVLENLYRKDGMVSMTYWDYGSKTLREIPERTFEKIIFGVSYFTK